MIARVPGSGVELRGIAKSFGPRRALEPATLAVPAGEVTALVGPNGAGKSTLLRILAGALKPTEGSASIAGWDVTRDPLRARRYLGYLPQRLGVPLTTVVRDLAELVVAAREVPFGAALDALAANALADRLDATLGELSGGQRQRVMLALATLGRVEALVLDEPDISLDAEASAEVRELIRAARQQGAAVLFASHHLTEVAQIADRLAIMVQGRIVAAGTIEELAWKAGIEWDGRPAEAPIERIYRTLVRGAPDMPREPALRVVRGGAA
jgi:ABC-type multidrug transport system ATPase subunit